MTVEVFKTNVRDWDHAKMLMDQIHKTFVDYNANFDLEDCDHILRVTSTTGFVHTSFLIDILKELGCHAEVLPDDFPPIEPGYADRSSQVSKLAQ